MSDILIQVLILIDPGQDAYFWQEAKQTKALKSEIDKTDKKIDRMVYELYGLTEDEIKIVEGSDH